jgi:hypothetical protein
MPHLPPIHGPRPFHLVGRIRRERVMQHEALCGRSAQSVQFLCVQLRAQGHGAHDLGVAPGEEGRAVEGREEVGLAVELAHLVERAVVGADAPVDYVAPDDLEGGRGKFERLGSFRLKGVQGLLSVLTMLHLKTF